MKQSHPFLWFLLILLISTGLAQSTGAGRNAGQLLREIQALEGRAGSYHSWSPALQKAYDQSLNTLYGAFSEAVGAEIGQTEQLLGAIADPAARRPLEEYLASLNKAREQANQRLTGQTALSLPRALVAAPASAGSVSAGAAPGDGNVAAPTSNPTPQPIPTPTPTPTPTVLTVVVRDKGTGVPIRKARVTLYLLDTSNSTPNDVESPEDYAETDNQGIACLPLRYNNEKYKIAVQKDNYYPYLQPSYITASDGKIPTASVNVYLTPLGDEYYRVLVGAEQSGASSTRSQQSAFVNFFFSHPLFRRPPCPQRKEPDAYRNDERQPKRKLSITDIACIPERADPPKWSLWGDLRLTSVPKGQQHLFKSFNSTFADNLTSSINGLTDQTAAVSFQAGIQKRFRQGYLAGRRFDISFVVGGGALTPLSPADSVELFQIPYSDEARQKKLLERLKFNAPSGFDPSILKPDKYTHIAFISTDRDRLLRSWYGGLRFETQYGDIVPTRPPAMFDVLIGQDETVTGGRMRGSVLKLDGFFPLPAYGGRLLYLFGSTSMGLARTKFGEPLLLPPADGMTTPTSEKTFMFTLPPANRDLYRFGVGFNVFELFKPGGGSK